MCAPPFPDGRLVLGPRQSISGCASINPIYTEATYDVICTDLVYGLYQIWVVQVTASFFIYCVLLTFPCAAYPNAEMGAKVGVMDDVAVMEDD